MALIKCFLEFFFLDFFKHRLGSEKLTDNEYSKRFKLLAHYYKTKLGNMRASQKAKDENQDLDSIFDELNDEDIDE
jgi:hypothetical protein